MSSERKVTTWGEPQLLGGVTGWRPRSSKQSEEPVAVGSSAAESRAAAEREAAYLRALNVPRMPGAELPEIKACALPDGFGQQVAQLDTQIYERGVAIDHKRLVSLGRERFEELLLKDREARTARLFGGSRTDLTQFREVFLICANLGLIAEIPIPARTMGEQVNGTGKEKDAVRKVESFADMWKLSSTEPNAIKDVYNFRDVFEPLVFAQSMLTSLDQNSRAHSQFFCGGNDKRVDYFTDCFAALKGKHLRVTLTNAFQSVMWWLCDETNEPIEATVLAREFLGVRSPDEQQIKLAQAVLDGFLLDYRDWELWNFVGAKTRKISRADWLSTWRKHLAKQFPAITNFHEQVRACFWRSGGGGGEYAGYRAFEAKAHRAFIDEIVQQLLHCASALLALAIEETAPSTVVARFQDRALCEVKHKAADLLKPCQDKLTSAFTGATFNVQIEEVHA